MIRSAYRWRSRLLCLIGRHDWAMHRNPEVSGRLANFALCRRCGTERDEYDPPVRAMEWRGGA
jgi:hypothetical protein